MNSIEIRRKIEDKLVGNGWDIVSYDCQGRNKITCRKAYATVDITYEMCSCHGGRIWLSEANHDRVYWEIEHPAYDGELGITDPESELLYEIDNELIGKLETLFSKMTFRLVTIKMDYNGRKEEDEEFFNTEDKAFQRLTENMFPNENLHTFESGTINYPNPTCHKKVTRIRKREEHSWDKYRYWFRIDQTWDDWKIDNKTCEAYIEVYEK